MGLWLHLLTSAGNYFKFSGLHLWILVKKKEKWEGEAAQRDKWHNGSLIWHIKRPFENRLIASQMDSNS